MTTDYLLLKTGMILEYLYSLKQIKGKVLYREVKSTTGPPAQRGRRREQKERETGYHRGDPKKSIASLVGCFCVLFPLSIPLCQSLGYYPRDSGNTVALQSELRTRLHILGGTSDHRCSSHPNRGGGKG